MSLKSGFFNSINHDRKYNAEDVAQLINALVTDGIIPTKGDEFMTVAGSGMTVNVKSGLAWFNSTWSLSENITPLKIDPSDVSRARIDAVVIDINRSNNVRDNQLKIVKGNPATTPSKPTLANGPDHFQHALAYVSVPALATSITAANIEIRVGQSDCPFATGKLESIDISDLFNQWEGEFDDWFNNLKTQLTDNAVTNLQNQINSCVKYSDKATSYDLLHGTPNKWVEARNYKGAPGDIIYSINSLFPLADNVKIADGGVSSLNITKGLYGFYAPVSRLAGSNHQNDPTRLLSLMSGAPNSPLIFYWDNRTVHIYDAHERSNSSISPFSEVPKVTINRDACAMANSSGYNSKIVYRYNPAGSSHFSVDVISGNGTFQLGQQMLKLVYNESRKTYLLFFDTYTSAGAKSNYVRVFTNDGKTDSKTNVLLPTTGTVQWYINMGSRTFLYIGGEYYEYDYSTNYPVKLGSGSTLTQLKEFGNNISVTNYDKIYASDTVYIHDKGNSWEVVQPETDIPTSPLLIKIDSEYYPIIFDIIKGDVAFQDYGAVYWYDGILRTQTNVTIPKELMNTTFLTATYSTQHRYLGSYCRNGYQQIYATILILRTPYEEWIDTFTVENLNKTYLPILPGAVVITK